MLQVGHFNVEARRREKQDSRDRDERIIASGLISSQQVAQRNGLFSALDPSKVRLVRRRAEIRAA